MQQLFNLYCDESCLMVLDDCDSFVLPWSAYYVEQQHQRDKLERRWKKFGKAV